MIQRLHRNAAIRTVLVALAIVITVIQWLYRNPIVRVVLLVLAVAVTKYYVSRYQGLILRITGAGVLSFLIVLFSAPSVIRFLIKCRLGDQVQFDHADLNKLTRHKSNTPTMGGILIVAAIFISVVIFADMWNMYIRMALLALVWLGVLGGVDDWIKLRHASGHGSRDGLKAWEKILFQIGLSVMLAIFMWSYGRGSNEAHSFYFPFSATPIALSVVVYVIIAVLTMVGTSNAVNLSDGMDGLASGCVCIVMMVLLVFSWLAGVREWAGVFSLPFIPASAEMTVLCSAMFGATLGFLWYNAPPAQVFMGDTGSLPLGGLIGYIAVVIRHELLLLIIGGVFVMEAASVIMQVGYFKYTRPGPGLPGTRIFRCAPLHHHYHLGGWAETKVVIRFWVLGIIFAAIAIATLKLR
ncbi:MAG: phospho-N-acetylmuramoyl-pentapeptide-transferase [Phycisphaerae bacterium]|nr:phospho-N-acetylmuramoyl-pentapeptide-transferase [Phycisphaerae bacterium]